MIRYAVITDTGVCRNNDDRVIINGEIISSGSLNGKSEKEIIAALCDGVGGYLYRDEVAEISCRALASLTGKPLNQNKIEI